MSDVHGVQSLDTLNDRKQTQAQLSPMLQGKENHNHPKYFNKKRSGKKNPLNNTREELLKVAPVEQYQQKNQEKPSQQRPQPLKYSQRPHPQRQEMLPPQSTQMHPQLKPQVQQQPRPQQQQQQQQRQQQRQLKQQQPNKVNNSLGIWRGSHPQHHTAPQFLLNQHPHQPPMMQQKQNDNQYTKKQHQYKKKGAQPFRSTPPHNPDTMFFFLGCGVPRVQYPFSNVRYPVSIDMELGLELHRVMEATEDSFVKAAALKVGSGGGVAQGLQ